MCEARNYPINFLLYLKKQGYGEKVETIWKLSLKFVTMILKLWNWLKEMWQTFQKQLDTKITALFLT